MGVRVLEIQLFCIPSSKFYYFMHIGGGGGGVGGGETPYFSISERRWATVTRKLFWFVLKTSRATLPKQNDVNSAHQQQQQ